MVDLPVVSGERSKLVQMIPRRQACGGAMMNVQREFDRFDSVSGVASLSSLTKARPRVRRIDVLVPNASWGVYTLGIWDLGEKGKK